MQNIKRKIILGSDHAGFLLKEAIKLHLSSNAYENTLEIIDCGCDSEKSVDYPDHANAVATEVLKNPENKGILVCGSGIGISIAANKVNGIRCALVHDYLSSKLSRQHNDSNIISIGAGFVGKELAKNIVDVYLATEFTGEERHQRRIDKMSEIEKNNPK